MGPPGPQLRDLARNALPVGIVPSFIALAHRPVRDCAALVRFALSKCPHLRKLSLT
jgi:hypothetical protein